MAQMYPGYPAPQLPEPPQQVVITNFNMPFWALTGFLIKVALASIPAMIVLTIVLSIIGFIITLILGLIGGGLAAILGGLSY